MKKVIWILTLVCMFTLLALPALAADSPTYAFELTVDGKDTLEATPGDIHTLTLRLRRTDADTPSTVYGMQTELRYNPKELELVEGSAAVRAGVSTSDIALADGYKEYYMNFLSLSGGTQWDADTVVGTVQFRVVGNSGVVNITNEDFLVSLPDGSGSYECTGNQLTLILSTDCTVEFQTNGGTPVDPQSVIFGEKIKRPADPTREGYHLTGWYTDIHLTDEWNFDEDTVQGNMTLYAKWAEGAPAADGMGALGYGLLLLGAAAVLLLLLVWKRRQKEETSPAAKS